MVCKLIKIKEAKLLHDNNKYFFHEIIFYLPLHRSWGIFFRKFEPNFVNPRFHYTFVDIIEHHKTKFVYLLDFKVRSLKVKVT